MNDRAQYVTELTTQSTKTQTHDNDTKADLRTLVFGFLPS